MNTRNSRDHSLIPNPPGIPEDAISITGMVQALSETPVPKMMIIVGEGSRLAQKVRREVALAIAADYHILEAERREALAYMASNRLDPGFWLRHRDGPEGAVPILLRESSEHFHALQLAEFDRAAADKSQTS